MIRGSCLCGGVRYEISGDLHDMHFCHCGMCRKAHGAAFATYAGLAPRDLRFTQGEELIGRYQSSDSAQRTFCRRCGSNFTFEPTATPGEIWIAAGGFDSEPRERPAFHIFVASKAPWFEISDAMKQYPGDNT